MQLTDIDKQMLNGDFGSDVQYAMNILVKLGDAFGAERMAKCDGAHLYSPGLYAYAWSDEEVERNLEHVREEKVKVRTKATCCACIPDMSAPPEIEGFRYSYIKKIKMCMDIYREMGVLLNVSCAPYLQGVLPMHGEHLEYTESSDWIFANSVLGARSNRGGFSAEFAAVTGRVPLYGMHLDHWRQANKVIRVETDVVTNTEVGALFFLVGKYCDQTWDVPVIDGLQRSLALEDYKQASGAISSSGAAAMFHIVGLTPEAPTLEAVTSDRRIAGEYVVTKETLAKAYQDLSCAKSDEIQMVIIGGCPHASIDEMKEIAELLDGKQVKRGVRVWVQTVPEVKEMARRMGWLETIEAAGADVLCNACAIMLVHERKTQSPMPAEVQNIATDQVKAAYFAPGQYDWGVWYGNKAECIRAAVTGKFSRDPANTIAAAD